ncbi:MAG TPA: V-type ATP synthase subunit I [Firmicutes bacterium]|nr:V-type ATP synthase subunit I [Candidatus Fermentithermobacillaceae bacterium]
MSSGSAVVAVARMRKVTIFITRDKKDAVLEKLRDLELMEVRETEESRHQEREEIPPDIQSKISRLQYVASYFQKYNPVKKGFIDMFTGKKPELSQDDLWQAVREYDVDRTFEKIRENEERLKELGQKLVGLESSIEALSAWAELDIPIKDLGRKTVYTENFLAVVPTLAWESRSGESLNGAVHGVKVWSNSSRTGLWFVASLEDVDKARLFVSSIGGSVVDLRQAAGQTRSTGTVASVIDALRAEGEAVRQEQERILASDKAMAEDLVAVLGLWDYYQDQKNLKEVTNSLQRTEYTFVIRGFVRAKDMDKLRQGLSEFTEMVIADEEPGMEDDPPVYLDNPPLLRPFEVITNIFGFPQYNEIDPTPVLAPFFWVFFGICLGDAVYGIILSLVCWVFLKTQKLGEGGEKLVRLLMYSGISTIIMGALMGSWFADLPTVFFGGTIIERFAKSVAVLDPIGDPLTLLVISFILGIIQIWVGILVKMYALIRAGEVKEAILSQGSWGILIPGLMGVIAQMAGVLDSTVPLYVTYLGALMVVYSASRGQKNILLKPFSGLYGLYSIVGYFSDTMSYSRLLALGLASAVIGVVVNKIAELVVSMVPVVGWVFVPLILLGGHVFNLVINVLGSFIHSGRLQFVEFFTKFFEGGGRPFRPLKRVSDNVSVN